KPKKKKVAIEVLAGQKRTAEYSEDREEMDNGDELDDPDGIYVTDESAADQVDLSKVSFSQGEVKKTVQAAYATAAEHGIMVSPHLQREALELMPKVQCFSQVAGLAKRVHDSATLNKSFKLRVKKHLGDKETKFALDRRVPTRWNTDHACLGAHIKLREAVVDLTGDENYDLAKYALTDVQWQLASELHQELTMFDRLTHILSESEVPLAHQTLPLYEELMAQLKKLQHNVKRSPVLRVAAIATMAIVNKYLGRAEKTEVHRIAIAMLPHRKLRWLREQWGWSPEDIDKAREIVITHWEHNYRGNNPPSITPLVAPAVATSNFDFDDWDSFTGSDTSFDTIQTYLDEPPIDKQLVAGARGVIPYWTSQLLIRPRVARFALDYLSAPAATTDVERAFSGGQLQVSHLQHNKSDETFRAQILLGSWESAPFFPDIVELTKTMEAYMKS
ncbi:hypothetical protein BKA62DRAFT_608870, partial [Auriculariales sp. MPI-PUGE-AT-0066]